MPHLWKITLTKQHKATYTCSLMNIPDASALKRLEIKWEPSGSLIAIVEPKPEGVYIKEVDVRGEQFGFRKENGMLLPAARKVGDTWQVSTQKEKNPFARILFKMEVTVVETEPQTLVLSVKVDINGRIRFKKVNETIEAVVSINPTDFQIERVQLNDDIYEKRT